MWLLSIILVLTTFSGSIPERKIFNYHSQKLHSTCLNFTPKSKNSPLTQAVVCGSQKEIPQNQLQLLKNSGLIHLIVVSASHLIFIEWFLSRIKLPFLLRFLVLFFYSFVTLLQAPVVRSLLHMLLEVGNRHLKLYWTHLELILFGFIVLYCYNREILNSYSALLSYCAALACTPRLSTFCKNTVVYILLIPVLVNLSPPHPISILFNLAFAPLIGFVAFPLSLLSFMIPLHFLIDPFWDFFFFILKTFNIDTLKSTVPLPLLSLWIYVLVLNCLMILKEKYEITRTLHGSYSTSSIP